MEVVLEDGWWQDLPLWLVVAAATVAVAVVVVGCCRKESLF